MKNATKHSRPWPAGVAGGWHRIPLLLLSLLTAGGLSAGCADDPTRPGGDGNEAVASVTVEPEVLTLEIGDTVTLKATVKGASGAALSRPVTWVSSIQERATVTTAGRVTALAAGEVLIQAQVDGQAGNALIEVEAAVQVVVPVVQAFYPATVAAGGPPATVVIEGSGFQPDVRVHWNGGWRPTTRISAEQVQVHLPADDFAEVGVAEVLVINPGDGTVSELALFEIVPQANPVALLAVRPALAVTRVGSPVPLAAVARNAHGERLNGRYVTWSSGNHQVATVNGEGLVTATGAGDAVITATSEGVTTTVDISVRSGETYHMLASDGTGLVSLDMRLGTGPTRFWEHGTTARALDPSPSPDGRYVVYTIETSGSSRLAIMDRVTRTYSFLADLGEADQPEWSPAGDRIAFRRRIGDRTYIYSVKPDGSDVRNLSAGLLEASSSSDPTWSPDATRIIFAIRTPGGMDGLMIMMADGSGKQPVTFGELDSQPTWRGDRVAFTRTDRATGATDVWSASVSGWGATYRLTESGDTHSPAWSPDMSWLAYVRGPSGASGAIMAMRPFGGDSRPVSLPSDGPGGGGMSPVWVTHR